MRSKSKTFKAVKIAFQKGYRVIKGQVFSSKGKIRTLALKNTRTHRYFSFTCVVEGQSYPILVHQLVAYQKFGEKLFESETVRHLDGDCRNNMEDNISIGTHRQNALDRNHEDRRKHAAKGGQKFTPEFIAMLRADHAAGFGYKKLEKMYKVPRSTLSYYLSDSAKRMSYSFPMK